MKSKIPPAVEIYVQRRIDNLFDPINHMKPLLKGGIILQEIYDQLTIEQQIHLHLLGVLIIPFYGEVIFPIDK